MVCLHGGIGGTNWVLTATTPAGSRLWEYHLPTGVYIGLGSANGGTLAVLHALTYRDVDGSITRNCVVRLDPQTGATTMLGVVDTSANRGRMSFAGDSLLIRTTRTQVELWSAAGKLQLQATANIAVPDPHNIDVLSPNLITITTVDGKSMWMVEPSSGITKEVPIVSVDIAQTRATVEQRIERSGADRSRLAAIGVIPVTGSDANRGLLCALLFPPISGGGVPLITLNAAGETFRLGALQLRNAVAVKLVRFGSELGVIYGDGNIDWYGL
jgi:hypothetical protein